MLVYKFSFAFCFFLFSLGLNEFEYESVYKWVNGFEYFRCDVVWVSEWILREKNFSHNERDNNMLHFISSKCLFRFILLSNKAVALKMLIHKIYFFDGQLLILILTACSLLHHIIQHPFYDNFLYLFIPDLTQCQRCRCHELSSSFS